MAKSKLLKSTKFQPSAHFAKYEIFAKRNLHVVIHSQNREMIWNQLKMVKILKTQLHFGVFKADNSEPTP